MLGLAAGCAAGALWALAGPAGADVAWTNVNPGGGGEFTCIGAGPTGIFIVGSDISGAYRSEDHGHTWQNVGYLNGGLERSYVSCLAFDDRDAQVVYLGGEGGLYRSQDGGVHFDPMIVDGFWTAVAVAASDPNVVYAARESTWDGVDPEIWKSTNRGTKWSRMASLPAGARVIKLAVKPDDSSRLFALSGYERLLSGSPPLRALYVSNDGGASWSDAHGDSTSQGMTGNPWDAAYDPVHPDTLFCTSVVGAGNVEEAADWSGATWRGSQSGGVWTQVSAHTGAIVIRPDTGEIITIDVRRDGPDCDECGVFTSSDEGVSWVHLDGMDQWDAGWTESIAWAYNGSLAGVAKTLGQDLSQPAVIDWVTPQFVWQSADGGGSFHSEFTDQTSPGFWRGRGITNVAPAALAVSGTTLFAGFFDLGIWRTLDAGASWQNTNDAGLTGQWAGNGGNCLTIETDPDRPDMVWASQGETPTSAWVIRNTEGGLPGEWTITLGVPPGFVTGLALDPLSPVTNRTLYVSSNGNVYKSADDGFTWSKAFPCDSCYVSAAWGSTVLTGGPKGLWKSTDGGTSWKELAPDLFHPGSNSDDLSSCKWYGAHDIHIAGDTMLVAAYGPDRGLYKSLDGGGSWSRLLPDDYALEVERDRYGTLLVGSSSATNAGGVGMSGATGVRISRDSGKTWTTLNSGLSWPFGWPIATMSVGDSARWFVGSPGTGFWTAVSTDGSPVAVHSGGAAPRLALSGFRPNPARGPVAIAFSLSSAEPAILEIFDLAGRRVARREVGGMGQGSHVLALDSTFRPTPGIYTIRLVQGARSVHARSVVVR